MHSGKGRPPPYTTQAAPAPRGARVGAGSATLQRLPRTTHELGEWAPGHGGPSAQRPAVTTVESPHGHAGDEAVAPGAAAEPDDRFLFPPGPGELDAAVVEAPIQRQTESTSPSPHDDDRFLFPPHPDDSGERRANRTGMPDGLKAGLEELSGIGLDDVRVHRDSPLPSQVQAAAFAQGTDIHLAPGQEHHLPHEGWHVVQQLQGRVGATFQATGGAAINDDAALEREADVMGERALARGDRGGARRRTSAPARPVVQLAPLGTVAHIRNSCYVATIINTFAVTHSLRNLLNPAVNDLSANAALAALQNLLHRAVNTVDVQQPVGDAWVAGIMTALVSTGVTADLGAQDVNEVTYELVRRLQNGVASAGQAGHDPSPAYAGRIGWGAGQSILQALAVIVGGGVNVPFDPLHPANVIHIERAPDNAQQAPAQFQAATAVGSPTYHLRSIVNRDLGSYDQAHFISYVDRGGPEWHENDDVGPRARPIADIGDVRTDPEILAERRRLLEARGVTPEAIDESEELQQVVTAAPVDVLGGAVMYVYEKAGAALQPAPDGGGRVVDNDAAVPDPSVFRQRYLEMLYEQRATLDPAEKSHLAQVLAGGEGYDEEVATLRAEVTRDILTRFLQGAATLLGLGGKERLATPDIDGEALATMPVADAQKLVLARCCAMLKRPKQGRKSAASHQVTGQAAQTIADDLARLFQEEDPRAIASFSEPELLLLAGWKNISISVPGTRNRQFHQRIAELEEAFLRRLNGFLDDAALQVSLEAAHRDRLLAVHAHLSADSVVGGSERVRGDESGIPSADNVSYDESFALFPQPTSDGPPQSPQSDVEDDPVLPDDQMALAQQQGLFSLFSTAGFGNHVPQPTEPALGRDNLSGLGPANTTAFVMRDDQLVPRSYGPALAPIANHNAHRLTPGVLSSGREGYPEGSAHAHLDALAGEQQDAFHANPSRPRHVLRETENQRRGMRHLLSNTVLFTEQSHLRGDEEEPALEDRRERLADQLGDVHPAERLVKRYRSKRDGSLGHAESLALRSRLWQSLTRRVTEAVGDEGEHQIVGGRLQVYLNRSSCEGCARRLILEAIRFWTELAEATELDSWRAARDRYRAEVQLVVAFSGNYFDGDPARFAEIFEALLDAGWHVSLLPRHKTTDEFTRQAVDTLTTMDSVLGRKGAPAHYGQQVRVSKRLRDDVVARDQGLERYFRDDADAEQPADEVEPSRRGPEDEHDESDDAPRGAVRGHNPFGLDLGSFKKRKTD